MKKSIFKNDINSMLETDIFYRRAKALTPGVWVFLCVLIVFIAGLLVFCFHGKLKTYVYTVAEVYDGESMLYVPDTDIDMILVGQDVEYEGNSNVDTVRACDSTPIPIPDSAALQNVVSDFGDYSKAETVYKCTAKTKLENGIYNAKIVVAEQSPFNAFFR